MLALLAASGAALSLALVLVTQALRARTRRRFDALLGLVDEQLASVSDSVRYTLDRAEEVAAGAVRVDELTFDALAGTRALPHEVELEREIARARDTQRPLSLVVVGIQDLAHPEAVGAVTAELARIVARVTRASDIVVARGPEAVMVLLPDTASEDARRLHGRLRAELATSFDDPSHNRTVSTGVVEWKPNESSQAFAARAAQALGRANVEPLRRRRDPLDLPGLG